MNLDEMLGIDLDDPQQRHAHELVHADEQMLDELVLLRRGKQLTQADVGQAMGISQGAVARIESGERDPHLSTLRRYAFAVGAVVSHKVTPVEKVSQERWGRSVPFVSEFRWAGLSSEIVRRHPQLAPRAR